MSGTENKCVSSAGGLGIPTYWPLINSEYRSLTQNIVKELYRLDRIPCWNALRAEFSGSTVQKPRENPSIRIHSYTHPNGVMKFTRIIFTNNHPTKCSGPELFLNGKPLNVGELQRFDEMYQNEKDARMYHIPVSIPNPKTYGLDPQAPIQCTFPLITVLAELSLPIAVARNSNEFIILFPELARSPISLLHEFAIIAMRSPATPLVFGRVPKVFVFYTYVDYLLAGNSLWERVFSQKYSSVMPYFNRFRFRWIKRHSELLFAERLALLYLVHKHFHPEIDRAILLQYYYQNNCVQMDHAKLEYLDDVLTHWDALYSSFCELNSQQ